MNWMGGLRFARIARLLLLCGLTSGFVTSHVKAQYAYMCGEFNEFDSAIWSYHIEPSGALTPIAGSPFPGPSFPAGSMALDPKGNYLYITDPTNALVWTYTIEKNGALTQHPLPVVTYGVEPGPLIVDPTGKYLFVVITNRSAEFGSGPATIAAYSIGPKGDLAPIPGSPFLSGNAFGGVTIDQTARFLYVPDQIDNEIAGFKIEPNGALTPLPGSPFGAGPVPFGMLMDPRGKFVYEFADIFDTLTFLIATYSISDEGNLVPIPSSPFDLTGGFPGDAAIDRNSLRLLVPNERGNSVSVCSIEAQGLLRQLPGSPFPITVSPTAISIESKGGFVYLGNFYGSSISGYKIGKNGALTPLPNSPFATGRYGGEIVIKEP
jgi:6-phosphogluconolactonase (cycloisomerase 2 family)